MITRWCSVIHLKGVLDAPGSLALATSAGQTQSHTHFITNLRQTILKNPAGKKKKIQLEAGCSLLSVGGTALRVFWMQVLQTTIGLQLISGGTHI